jgi:hypothetical protein
VLRAELVINDPEAFKVRRHVSRGGEPVTPHKDIDGLALFTQDLMPA